MKRKILIISAADGRGYAETEIYIASSEINEQIIEACKSHFVDEHNECELYMHRCDLTQMEVDGVSNERRYHPVKSILDWYKVKIENEEAREHEELARLLAKYG